LLHVLDKKTNAGGLATTTRTAIALLQQIRFHTTAMFYRKEHNSGFNDYLQLALAGCLQGH